MEKELLQHPSYATVHFARVEHGPRQLFGSSVKCQTTIQLTIEPAECERSLSRERIVTGSGKPYIQIEMTPNQFSELITHFNVQPGIPCTITELNGEPVDQQPYKPRTESIKDLFNAYVNTHDMKTITEAAALLERVGKSLTPTELQKVKAGVQQTAQFYKNLQFFVGCIDDMMSQLTTEAKLEFESWMLKRLQDIGLQTLKHLPQFQQNNVIQD